MASTAERRQSFFFESIVCALDQGYRTETLCSTKSVHRSDVSNLLCNGLYCRKMSELIFAWSVGV